MIRPVLAEIVGLVAFALQFGADVGGAAVLPDDGAVHGLPRRAVPHHRGLALVGDADRGDVLCLQAGLFQRLAADRDRRGPDVLGLVLDPARGREMLRKFLLRRGGDGDVAAEHDGARGRGALIDGQHKGHDVASPGGLLVAQEAIRLGEGSSISHRRPCERRDPYRVVPSVETSWLTAPATMAAGGYGSLLFAGTTVERARPTSPLSSRRRRPRWSGRS